MSVELPTPGARPVCACHDYPAMTPARQHIQLACREIARGGVIAYPTEGVYGLGCDPRNLDAVDTLLSLKARSASKGLILLAASLDQLMPFIAPLSQRLRRELDSTWPGPVTWLLPARQGVADVLTGARPTIAVRVTDHPVARALCEEAGTALVSTSANISGRAPALTAADVRLQFGDALDYVVSGELGGLNGPTEIRDGQTGAILRPLTPPKTAPAPDE